MLWLKYLFMSFEGRVGRKWWWLAGLLVFALMVPFHLLAWSLGVGDPNGKGIGFFIYLERAQIPTLLLTLLLFYPMLALYAKRLHDLGHSGKWAFAVLAPGLIFASTEAAGITHANDLQDALSLVVFSTVMILSLVITVYFGFIRGTRGDNQYGPDPLPADYDDLSRQSWGALMFRFAGRVPRSQFWIGMASALGILLVFFFFIGLIFSVVIEPLLKGVNFEKMTPEKVEKLFADPAISLPIGFLVLLAIIGLALFAYNALAISTKRLQDRNRSALWLLLPFALLVLLPLTRTLMPAIPASLANIGLLPALWLFTEAAFLSGTSGDNKYGPDPRLPQKTETAERK